MSERKSKTALVTTCDDFILKDKKLRLKTEKELQRATQILILFKEDRITEDQLLTYFDNLPRFMSQKSHFGRHNGIVRNADCSSSIHDTSVDYEMKRKRERNNSIFKNIPLQKKATALFQLDSLGIEQLDQVASSAGVPSDLLVKWNKPQHRNRIIEEWRASIVEGDAEGHSKKKKDTNDGKS